MRRKKIWMVDRENPDLEYALRFKKIRAMKGLNQLEFAKELGWSNTYISQIESGEKSISNEMIRRMAEVYKINPTWLLMGIGEIYLREREQREMHLVRFDELMDPDLETMITYCMKSSSVKHSVLGYFLRYKHRNKRVIDEELAEKQALREAKATREERVIKKPVKSKREVKVKRSKKSK